MPVTSKPEENVAIPATFKLVLMPTVELNVDLPATSKVSPTLTASSVVDPSTSKAPAMFTSLENTALPLTVAIPAKNV